MVNFFNNYIANKKLKNSKELCSLANLIILNLEQGIIYLQEYFPEIINKIRKKNAKLPEKLTKKFSHQFISKIKSFVIQTIPIEKEWEDHPAWYLALEIYREAILICPENIKPLWQIIQILHWNGKNDEAFAQYSKISFKKIHYHNNIHDIIFTTPAIIGMLISVGRKKDANDLAIAILNKFLENNDHDAKEMFFFGLVTESTFILKEGASDYIDLVKEINRSLLVDVAKHFFRNTLSNINDGNLTEALEWIDIVLKIDPDNQEFISIKKEIESDLKEGDRWDSIKSEGDFFRYLYRKMAYRFHPDLAKDEKGRIERTTIMSKINKARSNYDLYELKNITQEYAPDLVKHFKF